MGDWHGIIEEKCREMEDAMGIGSDQTISRKESEVKEFSNLRSHYYSSCLIDFICS